MFAVGTGNRAKGKRVQRDLEKGQGVREKVCALRWMPTGLERG
jgi:hypothetical protein